MWAPYLLKFRFLGWSLVFGIWVLYLTLEWRFGVMTKMAPLITGSVQTPWGELSSAFSDKSSARHFDSLIISPVASNTWTNKGRVNQYNFLTMKGHLLNSISFSRSAAMQHNPNRLLIIPLLNAHLIIIIRNLIISFIISIQRTPRALPLTRYPIWAFPLRNGSTRTKSRRETYLIEEVASVASSFCNDNEQQQEQTPGKAFH